MICSNKEVRAKLFYTDRNGSMCITCVSKIYRESKCRGREQNNKTGACGPSKGFRGEENFMYNV